MSGTHGYRDARARPINGCDHGPQNYLERRRALALLVLLVVTASAYGQTDNYVRPPKAFMQSKLEIRPGVMDFQHFSPTLLEICANARRLDEGGHPKVLGWTGSGNTYTLHTVWKKPIDFVVVNVMSPPSNGAISIVQEMRTVDPSTGRQITVPPFEFLWLTCSPDQASEDIVSWAKDQGKLPKAARAPVLRDEWISD